jgi:hypothetical protein
MNTVTEKLIRFIDDHRDDLVETTCNRLQKLYRSHYEVIEFDRHQEREIAFLAALVAALRDDDPELFYSHMEHIATERAQEGYGLDEVQDAVDTVQDTLWNLLRDTASHPDSQVEMLTLLNRLFRTAKNRLARVYLDRTTAVEKELDDLRQKFYRYRQRHTSSSEDIDTY